MNRLYVVLFSLFLLAGCFRQEEKNRDASKQIDQLYQHFAEAYDSLDTDMVADLYADKAYYLIPHPKAPILEGRSSIRKSFAGFIEGAEKNDRKINISFRIINRNIADSLAFDTGYYRTQSGPDTVAFGEGGSVGKFVTVMGLMPNGEWKFLLDGYSSAPQEAFLEVESAHNPASE